MEFFAELNKTIGAWGYVIIGVNLLLLLFARKLFSLFIPDESDTASFKRKLAVFQALNVLIIIGYGYMNVYYPLSSSQNKDDIAFGYLLIASLAIIYIAYLVITLSLYFIIQQYGKSREIRGVIRKTPTYQTRLLGIFVAIFISIVAMVSIINLLGYHRLLEAGGIIGAIGVILALTQSSWAPDIFSGLILLNSDMVQEGDVILIKEADQIYGVVYKTKVFHTVILNIKDNHRIMIRNTKLRDYTIHNLSKFASAKGLREKLAFKIGYDVEMSRIEAMFDDAIQALEKDKSIMLEIKHGIEYTVDDAGDHAIVWVVYYYTKEVSKLIALRQSLTEHFLRTSNAHKISLSTPLTHTVTHAD